MQSSYFVMALLSLDRDTVLNMPTLSREAKVISYISDAEQRLRQSRSYSLSNEATYIMLTNDGVGLRLNTLKDIAFHCLINLINFQEPTVTIYIQIDCNRNIDHQLYFYTTQETTNED